MEAIYETAWRWCRVDAVEHCRCIQRCAVRQEQRGSVGSCTGTTLAPRTVSNALASVPPLYHGSGDEKGSKQRRLRCHQAFTLRPLRSPKVTSRGKTDASGEPCARSCIRPSGAQARAPTHGPNAECRMESANSGTRPRTQTASVSQSGCVGRVAARGPRRGTACGCPIGLKEKSGTFFELNPCERVGCRRREIWAERWWISRWALLSPRSLQLPSVAGDATPGRVRPTGEGGPVEGDPSGVVVAWRGTAAGPRCTRLARAQASNDEHQRRVAPVLLSQLHARPGAHSTTSCDPLPGSLATKSEFERVAIIVVENLQ
ncbi:hypothetical protein L1887_54833 [Cichorium endivia]|nr:hypothetical protein L1887_54833 [Cichorium endivia]